MFRSRFRHLALSFAIATLPVVLATVPLAVPAGAYEAQKGQYAGDLPSNKNKRSAQTRRQDGRNVRPRDPAIFSSDVDLSRPGGPERYFELLSEETR
jgi:hypothetical protein